MKNVIVVPIYNEGVRAVETVQKILKNSKSEIVCVDDGSKDNSFELLSSNFKKNKKVLIIRHIINLGKGAAMKTGAEMAWKLKANAVIFIDADGQHNPKHLPDFEKALRKNSLIFGYREFDNEMPFIRKCGNIAALKLTKYLFNITRKDLLCGFLGFRKDIYSKIMWSSSRYGIETEMATRVAKYKIPFTEKKVDTIYIDKYKGVTILDAFKILIKIPSWYLAK